MAQEILEARALAFTEIADIAANTANPTIKSYAQDALDSFTIDPVAKLAFVVAQVAVAQGAGATDVRQRAIDLLAQVASETS